MKWNHIMYKQPEQEELIVQVDRTFEGHYCMGMRKYYQTISFEEYLAWCKAEEIDNPDFWWISAKDFPFPDK